MKKGSILILLIILMFIICKCVTYVDGIQFTRQDNGKYITRVQGAILCDKRVIQDWCEREPEYADIYIVYLYEDVKVQKHKGLFGEGDIDTAIILAFDKDKDGYYEIIYIDTNNDGYLDIQLQGRHLSNGEIKEYFCKYMHTEEIES